jgi:hypothetical protein
MKTVLSMHHFDYLMMKIEIKEIKLLKLLDLTDTTPIFLDPIVYCSCYHQQTTIRFSDDRNITMDAIHIIIVKCFE